MVTSLLVITVSSLQKIINFWNIENSSSPVTSSETEGPGVQVRNQCGEVWSSQKRRRAWRTDSARKQPALNVLDSLRGHAHESPGHHRHQVPLANGWEEAEGVPGEAGSLPIYTWVPFPNWSPSLSFITFLGVCWLMLFLRMCCLFLF